jgi:hypothetical protein
VSEGPALVHNVYFTLHDASPEAVEQLLRACVEYLAPSAGIRSFAAGTRVEEHERDVNDQAFDVSLHIVFESKACHDAYQSAPEHHRFITCCADNWKAVRVHDSFVREL